MNFSITAAACIIAMGLGNATMAEIYETKDAEGNTVFTDTPTAGAEEVELPKANITDAVKESPHPAPEPATKPATANKQAGQDNVIVIPDSRNERLEDELAADRPHEVLEADKRYEVGDNVTPEERARREAARTGEVVDKQGNVEIIRHQGHAGGHR